MEHIAKYLVKYEKMLAEAQEKAKKEQKPVQLSLGLSYKLA